MQNPQDKAFASCFKFGDDLSEVVVKVFNCKLGIYNGQLFITQNLICFYAKLFGLTKKKVIPFSIVSKLKVGNLVLTIKSLRSTKKRFSFKTDKEACDCHAITTSLKYPPLSSGKAVNIPGFAKRSINQLTTMRSNSGKLQYHNSFPRPPSSDDELQAVLSAADWSIIMKGIKTITYPAGTVIMKEGDKPHQLMQVVRGSVTLTMKIADDAIVTSTRTYGDILGEVAFLESSIHSPASMIADTETELYVVEYSYFDILLSVYEHLKPKVYKYFALLLYKRYCQYVSSFYWSSEKE